jgi:hypothetical protein
MGKDPQTVYPQQKAAILRERLVEHVPMSELRDKRKLHPTLFYQWQKAFFENGSAAFESQLTFMMLDRDIVAASPSGTYRVLKGAGLLDCWKPNPSFKGTGFVQPLSPHEHPSTGMSTSPPSTSPGPSSTSARCSTAARAPSFTGSCARP